MKIIDNPNELEHLCGKRRILRNKTDENSKHDLEKVDQELIVKYSDFMFGKILNEVKGMETLLKTNWASFSYAKLRW